MIDPKDIAAQINRNCNISDAKHAGNYSICGLALRLRDLFKWEKGLKPWEEKDSAEVLEWIGNKEEHWERIAEQNYQKLLIGENCYEPFDIDNINAVLKPLGLFYGAGYAHSLKPTFFLASVEEKKKIHEIGRAHV